MFFPNYCNNPQNNKIITKTKSFNVVSFNVDVVICFMRLVELDCLLKQPLEKNIFARCLKKFKKTVRVKSHSDALSFSIHSCFWFFFVRQN